jgi:rhomboid family GlyGly-CTERM serine protease
MPTLWHHEVVRERLFFVWLAALVVLFAAGGHIATRWLSYQRAPVERGELWRLLTGHLVHADSLHLGWNLVALLVIAAAVGPALEPRGWAAVSLASALAAGVGVHALAPRVDAMLGLSAVLHGQLAAGAWRAARGGERAAWALLALLVAKLGAERWGPLPWSVAALGDRVAVEAHLYGSVAGLLVGLLVDLLRKRRQAQ